MTKFLSKFFYILAGKEKALVIMLLLFLIISCLEMLGIGMVGPFIALAINPKSIEQTPLLKYIYTQFNFGSDQQFLTVLGLFVVFIFCVKSFVGFQVQRHIFNFGFNEQSELSSRLMKAYLLAPYTFHLNKNTATLIQNIINETTKFCNDVMMPLLTTVSNVFVIVALTFLLLKTDLMAAVAIASVVLPSFFLFQRFKERMSYLGKEGSQAHAEMIRIINHGLGGLKETRVIGCEGFFVDHMDQQASRFAKTVGDSVAITTLPRYVLEAFLMSFLIGFTILFLLFNQENPQSFSSVLGIFALASTRMMPAIANLLGSLTGIRGASYSLDQLYFDLKELEAANLVNARSLPGGTTSAAKSFSSLEKEVISFRGNIVLDQLSYQYPNSSRYALKQASLEIKKGETIGLIGKSGAGKTTLVDVILGLLTPDSGDIRVDGISIYSQLRSWQNIIGYVPQAIFLTDDTLERNVAFGVPDHEIDQQRLNDALELAQLTEVVSELPNGIKTMLGERGVRLSGGQRQRIGIARALYHEREVLVLDEATSALDNETERLVSDAIKALGGTKTIIIIAHRLSTIKHCDRVYKMEQGRIIESGSYREVVLEK